MALFVWSDETGGARPREKSEKETRVEGKEEEEVQQQRRQQIQDSGFRQLARAPHKKWRGAARVWVV